MESGGLSVGLIAGVSIAACVLILAIVLVVIYCFVKLKRDKVKTVQNVEEPGRADSSWSTKASSNYSVSTRDRSNASHTHGPDSSQEVSSISSNDSVFGYNNVSYNPNADDPKDRKKKVAFHTKHVYNNEGFESTGTATTGGDSSVEKIKYKKKESRNGSISRESRGGSSRRTRQHNSSVDKQDNVDSRHRSGTGEGRRSRSQDRKPSQDSRQSQDRKPSNDQLQRTHSGSRSSGRSRSRSSGRRTRSGSHGRRSGSYARSASSDGSRRSSHKSSIPPEQRPSISAVYANKAFRNDSDRTPSPEPHDVSSSHPESQV